MSLKQKYTWADFKREQGDKAKDMKRTSPEGQKAFEAAQKAKIKAHVADRTKNAKKQQENAAKEMKTLRDSLKGLKTPRRKQAVLRAITKTTRRQAHFTRALARNEASEA